MHVQAQYIGILRYGYTNRNVSVCRSMELFCSVLFHEGYGTIHVEFFPWSSMKNGTDPNPIFLGIAN